MKEKFNLKKLKKYANEKNIEYIETSAITGFFRNCKKSLFKQI